MRFNYMQNELVLVSKDDINIYDSDLDIACEMYLSKLKDPELLYKSSNTFIGLLSYIRMTVLKPILTFTRYDKNKYDYSLLDNIYNNIYVKLCSDYDKTPIIITFCEYLVDIDSEYISRVYTGALKANPAAVQTIKKWYSNSKGANLSKVVDNNSIGAMFNLKANYGMSDQRPQQVIVSATPAACLSADVLSSLLPDSDTEKVDI
jgi:hypothetical protein